MDKVKFKPDQVWRRKGTGEQFRLSRFEGVYIYGVDAFGNEKAFAMVDAKGFGTIDTYYWMEVVPRECLCGTNREVCTYHKPTHYQIVDK